MALKGDFITNPEDNPYGEPDYPTKGMWHRLIRGTDVSPEERLLELNEEVVSVSANDLVALLDRKPIPRFETCIANRYGDDLPTLAMVALFTTQAQENWDLIRRGVIVGAKNDGRNITISVRVPKDHNPKAEAFDVEVSDEQRAAAYDQIVTSTREMPHPKYLKVTKDTPIEDTEVIEIDVTPDDKINIIISG